MLQPWFSLDESTNFRSESRAGVARRDLIALSVGFLLRRSFYSLSSFVLESELNSRRSSFTSSGEWSNRKFRPENASRKIAYEFTPSTAGLAMSNFEDLGSRIRLTRIDWVLLIISKTPPNSKFPGEFSQGSKNHPLQEYTRKFDWKYIDSYEDWLLKFSLVS